MKQGAVVLLPLIQADGKVKPRPAVALRQVARLRRLAGVLREHAASPIGGWI